jgi:hypothetical protein
MSPSPDKRYNPSSRKRNERQAILAEQRVARQLLRDHGPELEDIFPGISAKLKSNNPENFRPAMEQAKPWLEERARTEEPTPVVETPIVDPPKSRGVVIESGGPPDVLDTFSGGRYKPNPTSGSPRTNHGTGKRGRRHDPGHRSSLR